jgi:hypothetical protein
MLNTFVVKSCEDFTEKSQFDCPFGIFKLFLQVEHTIDNCVVMNLKTGNSLLSSS